MTKKDDKKLTPQELYVTLTIKNPGVWGIDPCINGGYPYLIENPPCESKSEGE